MAISKPSWLRSWLSRLNWDIFTWKVYIGDAIEGAIDWAVGWINWGIDQAAKAYNWAQQALARANEVWRELTSIIYREVDRVAGQVSTWWSDLGDWWSAKAQDVKWWIDTARSFLQSQITSLGRSLDGLRIAWDNYWRYVVPTLLSIDKWTAFWGGAWQNVTDWWGARLDQVRDLIETNVKPVRDEVNKHTSWFELIKELIDDPQKWLLNQIEKMLARFW